MPSYKIITHNITKSIVKSVVELVTCRKNTPRPLISDQLDSISTVVHLFSPARIRTGSPNSHKNSHHHGENDKIYEEPQHINRTEFTSKPVYSREQKIRVIHVDGNVVLLENG